jgi:hypothetical protein
LEGKTCRRKWRPPNSSSVSQTMNCDCNRSKKVQRFSVRQCWRMLVSTLTDCVPLSRAVLRKLLPRHTISVTLQMHHVERPSYQVHSGRSPLQFQRFHPQQLVACTSWSTFTVPTPMNPDSLVQPRLRDTVTGTNSAGLDVHVPRVVEAERRG